MNTTDMTVPALLAAHRDLTAEGFTTEVKVNTKTKKADLILAVNQQLAQRESKKPAPRKGAHADCDHETTKAARAKCRRTRAAEAIAGDQLEAASKGKKGRKLHAVAS